MIYNDNITLFGDIKMKSIIFLFFTIIFLTFISCADSPQIAEIQVINNSSAEVTNLIIYMPLMGEMKTAKIIDCLLPGKSISFKYDYINDQFIKPRTASSAAKIEYYIGGVKFDMANGDSEYIPLSNGIKEIITITDNGWSLKSK